ncbi:hypothetical protein ACSBR1_017931 [Camellia fascicularis]
MKCCNQFYKWDDRNKDLASVVISSILLLFPLIVGIFYRLGAIHHVGEAEMNGFVNALGVFLQSVSSKRKNGTARVEYPCFSCWDDQQYYRTVMCVNFMFAGNNRYEEDPIAKRSPASPQRNVLENKDVAMANDALQTVVKESGMKESAVSELQKRLEISVSLSSPETQIIDELEDRIS